MDNQPNIAIVIPVYKSDFFEETFESIVAQTDMNFHVYIGNDAGDKRIEEIIHSSGSYENVTYHYFEDNLGQKSLTLHWSRCLDMVKDENWIWLFSDDDVMDDDCIENFRKTQLINPDTFIFKFDSIKFAGETLLKENNFPAKFSLDDFMKIKFNNTTESYAVEYIFNKALLRQTGGFSDYPLAWCSDDLFWIKCMLFSGVVTIPESLVYWRHSGQNISGRKNTAEIASQKMKACCMFMEDLIKMNIFKRKEEIEYCFFRWIISQYAYLRNSLHKEEQDFYLSEILNSLPGAAQRYKQNLKNA